MRALSLWQPYASLLVHGLKRCETRKARWAKVLTPGPILIHAAQRWTRGQVEACSHEQTTQG